MTSKYDQLPKSEVNQINPESGLSEDYTNQVNSLMMNLRLLAENSVTVSDFKGQVSDQATENQGTLIKKYEDLYGPESINETNKENVIKVNEVAERINDAYSKGTLTIRDFINASNEIYMIVKRRDMNNIPELSAEVLETIITA